MTDVYLIAEPGTGRAYLDPAALLGALNGSIRPRAGIFKNRKAVIYSQEDTYYAARQALVDAVETGTDSWTDLTEDPNVKNCRKHHGTDVI